MINKNINKKEQNQPELQKTDEQDILPVAFYKRLKYSNHTNPCPMKHQASHFHQINLDV